MSKSSKKIKMDEGHFYPVNNDGSIVYPSVTTILSNMLPEPPELTKWKNRRHDWKEYLEYTARRGTLVHYRVLNSISDVLLPLPHEVPFCEWTSDMVNEVGYAYAMFEDLNLNISHPIQTEFMIVNHKYKYAGRCDLYATIDGIRTLTDLKTSKAVRDTHMLQLGGYYSALPKDDKPERGLVIGLNPEFKTNPQLKAHLYHFTKEDLLKFEKQFIEIAKEFHEIFDYTEFQANQNGD